MRALLLALVIPLTAFADECCHAPCWGFSLSVDPLIWKAHVGGLAVATQTKGSTSLFNDTGQSHVKNLNYKWVWGVRAAIGIDTPHESIDAKLQWTTWNPNGTKDLTATDTSSNFPHAGHPAQLQDETPSKVKARWEMHYNLLDLENGIEIPIANCISLRPFAGLRAAWIRQSFDLDYNQIQEINYDVDQKSRFFGIGIRGGADIEWGLGCGWSLFSNYGANLLYVYHSIKHKEKSDTEIALNVSDFFHIASSIFDAQLGLRYDWLSCDECYHLGFDLGWELHYHPNQNQFLLFVDSEMDGKFAMNQGDLGIHGFYLRARFDF